MKKNLVLLAMVLLSGCAIALSPEFSTNVNKDLGVTPDIYYRADWIRGVYGYSSFVESMSSKIQITRGALVVTDKKVALVRFDKQIQKYDYIFELKYSDLTDVRVFKKGLGRRLVLKTENNTYTLEVIKGGVINRQQTYRFAVYIADRLGKDSSEFSRELEKEGGTVIQREPIEPKKESIQPKKMEEPKKEVEKIEPKPEPKKSRRDLGNCLAYW